MPVLAETEIIVIPTKRRKLQEATRGKIIQYRKWIQEGRTIKGMAYAAGFDPRSIHDFFIKRGLIDEYRKLHPLKDGLGGYAGIENLAAQGVPRVEIGEYYYGVTKERARQKLNRLGLYDTWKEANHHNKIRPGIQKLVDLLNLKIEIERPDGNVVYQKAWKEVYGRKIPTHPFAIPFENVLMFYRRYFYAQATGEKPALHELARGLFSTNQASVLVRKGNLKPFHNTGKRRKIQTT